MVIQIEKELRQATRDYIIAVWGGIIAGIIIVVTNPELTGGIELLAMLSIFFFIIAGWLIMYSLYKIKKNFYNTRKITKIFFYCGLTSLAFSLIYKIKTLKGLYFLFVGLIAIMPFAIKKLKKGINKFTVSKRLTNK